MAQWGDEAGFAEDAPGASSTFREHSKLCPCHEQAWMSLVTTELDKICLVCSVNAMIWFERHHKLNGPSSSYTYCLLGAAGLPGQQQKWS